MNDPERLDTERKDAIIGSLNHFITTIKQITVQTILLHNN